MFALKNVPPEDRRTDRIASLPAGGHSYPAATAGQP
jgi:hypothetical protein